MSNEKGPGDVSPGPTTLALLRERNHRARPRGVRRDYFVSFVRLGDSHSHRALVPRRRYDYSLDPVSVAIAEKDKRVPVY